MSGIDHPPRAADGTGASPCGRGTANDPSRAPRCAARRVRVADPPETAARVWASIEAPPTITGPRMTDQLTLDDFPARTFDKLRYGDTDRQGHVNNAVFATYFETGRVEMLLADGGEFLEPGQSLVLARLEIDLLAEINWPGTVEIGTRVAKIGRSSMTLEQAVFQNGRLAARGISVVVLTDETTRRSTPLGEAALERLRAHMVGTGGASG